MNKRNLILLIVAFLISGHDVYADGMWKSDGANVWNNSQNPGYTSADYSEGVPDGTGGAYIFIKLSNGSDFWWCLQRVDSYGNTLWPEGGIKLTASPNHGGYALVPRCISDENKNAIVIFGREYSGGTDMVLAAQKVDQNGNKLWGPNGVAITSTFAYLSGKADINYDGSGHYLIVWMSSSNSYLHAKRIDSDGNNLPWFQENLYLDGYSDFKIINNSNGYFIIRRESSYLRCCFITNEGNINWDTNIKYYSSTVYNFDALMDSLGRIIIVDDLNDRITAQGVDANGNTLWGNGVQICNTTSNFPRIANAGSGTEFITWSAGGDIYCQKLDQNGTPLWATNGISICSETGNQNFPKIEEAGYDGAIIAWSDARNGTPADVYLMRINNLGNKLWGIDVLFDANIASNFEMGGNNSGGYFISWGESTYVKAQKIIRPSPRIISVDPTTVVQGPLNLNITGKYFTDDLGTVSYITLTRTGQEGIIGNSLVVSDATSMSAQFNLSNALPGLWYLAGCDSTGQSLTVSGSNSITVILATPTMTPTVTTTPTISPTPSITPTYTVTSTFTPTSTITPTDTVSPTVTTTPTITLTNTFSPTAISTATYTPSCFYTVTATQISNQTGSKEIVAYPNPARDQVRFAWAETSVEKVKISVYNLNGEQVSLLTANSLGQTLTWNVSSIASGMYFYRVVLTVNGSEKSLSVQKLAIVRP